VDAQEIKSNLDAIAIAISEKENNSKKPKDKKTGPTPMAWNYIEASKRL